ncbi:MAG: hypothetical protein KKD17_00085 [Nanoarchaeota archaeon]|nr:hypothetical protein [Nanoarchaeota archaeon]
MNVKKAIKKVVALGVGVSMLGATLIGATASPYDLSEFPAPFIKDGMFNGLMVVGDDAAPADIIGVTDIAMSLQYSSTIKETIKVSSEAGVALGGDSVKIQRSGDVLELREWLGGVTETMDSSDAEALKSFTVSNDKGTTDVNQYLRFNWGNSPINNTAVPADASAARVMYTKDDDDNVGDFLWFKDGEEAFKYELEFVEGFESDIATDRSLDDLEDETLHILGEDFAVISASFSTAGKLTLNLMGGAIHDTIEEGETKTYTLKGKEYEVTALIISDWAGAVGSANVKLKVNGEVTKQMEEGSTEILNDGTTIGIREVLPNEAGETAGGDILEFYLGAFKIKFEDTTSTLYDGNTEVNEENIEDSDLSIEWTNTTDTVRINKIGYILFTDGISGDEPYIAPGQGYKEKLDEPEGLLADAWDFRYEGLSDPGATEIRLKSSGDDEYRLSFTNTQGIEYSNVRFVYANGTALLYGDDDDALIFEQGTGSDAGNFTIKKSDYLVLSHNGGTDTGVTRMLRLDSVDVSNSLIQMTDVGTGGSINSQFTGTLAGTWTNCQGLINVGGYSFDFYCLNSSSTGKGQIQLLVDLDDDGTVGGEAGVVVNGGGMLDLGDQTAAAYRPSVAAGWFWLNVTTDDNNFDEAPLTGDEVFVVNVSGSVEVDLDVLSNSSIGLSFNSPEDNSDINMGMTDYGVLIKETNEDNDPDSLTITYPKAQLLPQAFVTFEKTVTMEGGAGTITVERPQRIEIGSAVLASQVSDPTAANIVTVGGPCINSVTAEIMGLTYPACGADSGFGEGEGIVKLYESGEKVAIVVAGWEAEDTTRATRVLADYKTYQEAGKLVGTEVKVTGTSATEFTVTPVSGEAPAEE